MTASPFGELGGDYFESRRSWGNLRRSCNDLRNLSMRVVYSVTKNLTNRRMHNDEEREPFNQENFLKIERMRLRQGGDAPPPVPLVL